MVPPHEKEHQSLGRKIVVGENLGEKEVDFEGR